MAIKKIIVNNVVNMDVSQDTVTENTLLNTYTAHKSDGTQITGTYVPSGSGTYQSKTVSVTPTESTQTQTVSPDSGYDALSSVTVNTSAIDSEYVGSEVPKNEGVAVLFTDQVLLGRKSKLLQANVLAGYYESSDSYSAPEATFNSATSVSINSSGDATVTFSPATHGVAYEVETYTVTKTGAVTPRTSSDLTSSGATVTAPAGYYSAAASKSIANGSATTPSTTITANPTISVNTTTGLITASTSASQSITPTVSAGYISNGTAGTVSVSGSATEQLSVKSSTDLTVSGATVTAPAGFYPSNASKSVASGTVTAPASISGTSASVSTGTNTITLSKTVSVTPSVSTAGYVSAGTAGNSAVSLTASVTTKAAATITPGTTNQTIAAGTYLTGAQTIVGDADLVGSNILSTANIFGVQGTVTFQTYYTGSSAPSSSQGVNGDIYLQT